jgi:cohesin complex subunit SA-1/2
MDGTNLVRMLRESARKAVGERIVPAVDNRKLYYNKGQKVSSPFLWSFSL